MHMPRRFINAFTLTVQDAVPLVNSGMCAPHRKRPRLQQQNLIMERIMSTSCAKCVQPATKSRNYNALFVLKYNPPLIYAYLAADMRFAGNAMGYPV